MSPLAVFVAWRSAAHERAYPVARLSRIQSIQSDESGGRFEFCYIEGARDALSSGFREIVPFRDLDAVYHSDILFPFFANRILSSSRPEYQAFLERILVSHFDPLEILARTGGFRATDSFETFPLPRFEPQLPGFRTYFLAHALRYLSRASVDRIGSLRVGEPLYMMRDCQNEYDARAVALRTTDRTVVGYVPSYLLFDVYELADRCEDMRFSVQQVNEGAPLDQRLLISLKACWPAQYSPLIGHQFLPISAHATPTVALSGGIPAAELRREQAG